MVGMKKYRVLIFLLFAVAGIAANGQEADSITDSDYIDPVYSKGLVNDVPNRKPNANKKLNYNLTAGMNYSFSPNRYAGPGYYLNPSLNYDATKKLNLSVGTGFAYHQFQDLSSEGELETSPMMTYFVYTQGTYKLSENIVVDGRVTYARNDVPNRNKKDNNDNSFIQDDLTSYSFGLTYRIRPNVTFGVHFDFSNSPYYTNGVHNRGYAPYLLNSPYGFGY